MSVTNDLILQHNMVRVRILNDPAAAAVSIATIYFKL